jgi:membrane protein implicated in regulation of membrane protease activity
VPRRSRKADKLLFEALFFLGIIGAIGFGISKFFETVGFVIPIVATVAVVALYFFLKWSNKRTQEKKRAELAQKHKQALEARKIALLEKYKDEEIVANIIERRLWVGQTREQLVDSFGAPHDIDERVLKTKKKETWKYGHKGANRYEYRVTLESDHVVGWDEKA